MLIAAVLGVSACGGDDPPAPTPTLPANWPTPQGTAVRQVPVPALQLLGYLPELTAGHALCTALSPEDWRSALRGEVRTEVFLTEECHVVSGRFDLTARLSRDPVTGSDTVSGRSARLDRRPGSSNLAVELVNEITAERYPGLRPTLSITVTPRDPATPDTETEPVARAVAEALLRRLPVEPPLPRLNEKGEIAPPAARPPLPGFGVADQPLPVAAEQLCTVLAEALRVELTAAVAELGGSCAVRGRFGRVSAAVTQAGRDPGYRGNVAGRPVARDGAEQVWVGLRDDSAQQVQVSGPVPEEVLAAIVPRLVGR